MTALTPFHTAREAGETCAQRRHGKGQARPVKLNREYLGSLWAGHQQDSRSHAWQCTKAQIPPGKSNERGRWFESTSKALSQPPPIQILPKKYLSVWEGNWTRYLWNKPLWERDDHAALSVRINAPSQSLCSQTANCNFLREDCEFAAM